MPQSIHVSLITIGLKPLVSQRTICQIAVQSTCTLLQWCWREGISLSGTMRCKCMINSFVCMWKNPVVRLQNFQLCYNWPRDKACVELDYIMTFVQFTMRAWMTGCCEGALINVKDCFKCWVEAEHEIPSMNCSWSGSIMWRHGGGIREAQSAPAGIQMNER